MASTPSQGGHRGLRRVGGAVLSLALGLGLVVLLLLFLNSRDDAGVETAGDGGAAAAPGQVLDDPERWLAGEALDRLRAGNVFLLHAERRAPPELVAIREALSGPPDPVLEDAGQAVILRRDADVDGVVALAWGRQLTARSAADERLEPFAEHWLGRGAAGGD